MIFRKKTSKKNAKKSNLFGFFYKYWLTFVLLAIVFTLIRQSIFINKFPYILESKREVINETMSQNKAIILRNNSLVMELKTGSEPNMEILESQARFRFGYIKDGETYYQIRKSEQEPLIDGVNTDK
ncbi:MAG TPA: cell division protein FtsB [Gammaproteobacteria bacterium]|nr:cell division protein FtsB [Gammaproteobacteria bacterium]